VIFNICSGLTRWRTGCHNRCWYVYRLPNGRDWGEWAVNGLDVRAICTNCRQTTASRMRDKFVVGFAWLSIKQLADHYLNRRRGKSSAPENHSSHSNKHFSPIASVFPRLSFTVGSRVENLWSPWLPRPQDAIKLLPRSISKMHLFLVVMGSLQVILNFVAKVLRHV